MSTVLCVCQNCKCCNTHLYLTRHYSLVTHDTAFFQAENDWLDYSVYTETCKYHKQQYCHLAVNLKIFDPTTQIYLIWRTCCDEWQFTNSCLYLTLDNYIGCKW
jgi:hypothetical protein